MVANDHFEVDGATVRVWKCQCLTHEHLPFLSEALHREHRCQRTTSQLQTTNTGIVPEAECGIDADVVTKALEVVRSDRLTCELAHLSKDNNDDLMQIFLAWANAGQRKWAQNRVRESWSSESILQGSRIGVTVCTG
jgi:hypothetical protein